MGYDNVDWFVEEGLNLENKKAFYFKNTNADFFMTEEDEEQCRNSNICKF